MKAHVITPPTAGEPDFRAVLELELGRRCAKNPRYSLRAFAQNLGIDHSTLSQILRRRRRLTPTTVRRLGAKLGLGPEAIGEHARAAAVGSDPAPSAPEQGLRAVARDAAAVLGDWHHFAILELLRLPTFLPDVRWIARVLGTTADRVNLALQQLIRLGLLRMETESRWVDTLGDVTLSERRVGQAALDRLVERARGAEASHQGSFTFTLPAAELPAALARLEALRRDLARLADRADGDTVYRFDFALVPLTLNSSEEPPS